MVREVEQFFFCELTGRCFFSKKDQDEARRQLEKLRNDLNETKKESKKRKKLIETQQKMLMAQQTTHHSVFFFSLTLD